MSSRVWRADRGLDEEPLVYPPVGNGRRQIDDSVFSLRAEKGFTPVLAQAVRQTQTALTLVSA